MKHISPRIGALALGVTLFCAAPAPAADLTAVARGVFEKAQKTVVTARLVIKMSMGSRESEHKLEAIGTVVDASGLTVVPLAAADPSVAARAMMRGRPGAQDFKLDAKVTEAAIVTPDGTELEADVVFRDSNLGMAFLLPRDAAGKLDAVELKPARPLAVLDPLILVGRYGRSANRVAWVDTTSVRAIVKGPRTYALCAEDASAAAVGTIAWSADGAPAGVFVSHVQADPDGGRSFGGAARGGGVVLRPIDDLIEVVKEARKAKPPAPDKADAQPASASEPAK